MVNDESVSTSTSYLSAASALVAKKSRWPRRSACATLIGERWTLLVVRELPLGPKRFTNLRTGERAPPESDLLRKQLVLRLASDTGRYQKL